MTDEDLADLRAHLAPALEALDEHRDTAERLAACETLTECSRWLTHAELVRVGEVLMECARFAPTPHRRACAISLIPRYVRLWG